MNREYALVSIVIPVFNAEAFLADAINSCLEQSYKSIEIICVDNNSSDGSAALLESYKKIYPQVKIFSEKEPGAPAARNKGVEEAKGEFICFLDADDALLPEAIECFLKYMGKDIDATSGGEMYFFSEFSGAPAYQRYRIKNLDNNASDILYNHPNTGAILLRKSTIKNVKWNNNLRSAQELVFCIDLCLLNNTKFYFFAEPVCKIRIHNSPFRISNQGRKQLAYNRYIAILKIESTLERSLYKSTLIEIALNDYRLKNAFMAINARNFKISRLLSARIDKKLIKKSAFFQDYSKEWVTFYTNLYVGFLFHFLNYKILGIEYEKRRKTLIYQRF